MVIFESTIKGLLQSYGFCDSMDLFFVCLFAHAKACLGHIKDVKCTKPRTEIMGSAWISQQVQSGWGRKGKLSLEMCQIFRDEGTRISLAGTWGKTSLTSLERQLRRAARNPRTTEGGKGLSGHQVHPALPSSLQNPVPM